MSQAQGPGIEGEAFSGMNSCAFEESEKPTIITLTDNTTIDLSFTTSLP
jgi:hypothetical protein